MDSSPTCPHDDVRAIIFVAGRLHPTLSLLQMLTLRVIWYTLQVAINHHIIRQTVFRLVLRSFIDAVPRKHKSRQSYLRYRTWYHLRTCTAVHRLIISDTWLKYCSTSVADVCMLCLSYPVLGHDIALSNALRCIISVS